MEINLNYPMFGTGPDSCFGTYNREERVCTKLCALRLRCAIEYERNNRLELLEELIAAEEPFSTTQ